MTNGKVFPETLAPLVLAGAVESGRYLVRFGCSTVRLPYTRFLALVDLVHARLTSTTGLTPLPALPEKRYLVNQTLHRLRKDLDAVLGQGSGALLVVHANRRCYFLGLRAEQVVIDLSIADLAPNHLSSKLVSTLLGVATQSRADCKRTVSER